MDRRLYAARARFTSGRRPFMCLLLAGLTAVGSSCTRPFYRKQADKEVNAVLAEKDCNANWHIEQFHVYPDPRARFADPTDPDHPPMPPDDPAARILAPNPQKPPHQAGIARVEGTGYLDMLKGWDACNRALQPQPDESAIPLDPKDR